MGLVETDMPASRWLSIPSFFLPLLLLRYKLVDLGSSQLSQPLLLRELQRHSLRGILPSDL